MNDTTKNLKAVSRDYRQLGIEAKDQGTQMVFSTVLLMEGEHPVREWKLLEHNLH